MANKENWEVSYIDEDGVYNGGVNGVVGGTVGSYTASGAIAITDSLALVDLIAGAITLANGVAGQVITIKATNASTAALVLTPSFFTDGTTITFDAQYEVATLQFDGTSWQLLYTDATVA